MLYCISFNNKILPQLFHIRYDVTQPINTKIKTFHDEYMRDKNVINALFSFRLEIGFPHSIHAGIKIIQILV